MQPETLKYLYDIEQACQAIFGFIKGKALLDYDCDNLLRSAIERQLTIAGEALNLAVKTEPEIATRISNVREIINLRNVIVHGYTTVENETIWGILQSDLLQLSREVESIFHK